MELSPKAFPFGEGACRKRTVQEASQRKLALEQLLGLKPGKTTAKTGRVKRAMLGDQYRTLQRDYSAWITRPASHLLWTLYVRTTRTHARFPPSERPATSRYSAWGLLLTF